jgi:two-component system, NarL family, nitrate/nitrite response regulator NarL
VTRAAPSLSLVIADDHPLLLEGMVRVLRAERDLNVRASCNSGGEALQAIRLHQPAVAILDVAMPDMTGLQVMAALNAERSPTKVVFLTANATDANIFSMVEGGAFGLLLKDTAIEGVVSCIRQVAGGRRSFPPDMITAALERETGRRTRLDQFVQALSAREREILPLVAKGLENKEIAHRLGLSEGTVRLHMHHIYQKTEIGSRAALIAMALAYSEMADQ